MFGKYKIDDLYVGVIIQIKDIIKLDHRFFGNVNIKQTPIEYGIFKKYSDIYYTNIEYVRVTTKEKFEKYGLTDKIGDYRVDERTVKKLKYVFDFEDNKKYLSKKELMALEKALNEKNKKWIQEKSTEEEKAYEA